MSKTTLDDQFPKTHHMRVRFKILGNHTHMQIWCSNLKQQGAKVGELTMLNSEFEAWRSGNMLIDFSEQASE
jgi:hypothetical protein